MTTQHVEPARTGRSGDRRAQLLDTAERLFAEHGIDGSTVSEITSATGVAKGTFYLYFDSKEELLGALKERFLEGMVQRIGDAVEGLGSDRVLERVDRIVATSLDHQLAHRGLLRVAVRESADPGTAQLFAEANRRMIGLIEAAIHTGANVDQVRVDDPELTAALIHFGMTGTVNHFLLYEEEVDRERLVAASRALVRRALGAPTEPPNGTDASQEPPSGTV